MFYSLFTDYRFIELTLVFTTDEFTCHKKHNKLANNYPVNYNIKVLLENRDI